MWKPQLNMTDTPTLPSDRQLVDASRAGHEAAWQELMARHEDAIRAVLPHRRPGAKRKVTQSLEAFKVELGDDTTETAEAIRAFRPRAFAFVTGGSYGPISESVGDARVDDDDRLLASAFGQLPEPWQTVLWHSLVEQLSAAEVSPLVGRSVNEVNELLATAERGLVDAYLLEYSDEGVFDDASSTLIPLLSGHVRGALPPHEQRRVDAHLAFVDADVAAEPHVLQPDDSRRLIRVASSIPEVLPSAIAPGVTQLTVAEHREALGTTSRSFGAAAMFANRSDRARRVIIVFSVAAVALALVGVASLVRQPFENDNTGTNPAITSVPSPTTDGEPVTTTADGGVVETTPATTTTTLDLRPAPTGLANAIEVVVASGPRAIGFVAPAAEISTVVSTSAPVFSGGTGTLDMVMANSGDTDFDGTIELLVPRGVVLDGLVSGDAECTDPDDDSPFCNISIEAGGTRDFSLRIVLESSVVGRLTVEGATLPEDFEEQIVATRDLVHNSVGRGDVTIIGNSVMTCADVAASELGIDCDAVRDGVGDIVNRWDVPMEFIGTAPQFGFVNGSKATLEISDDARIVHAELFWSGDLEVSGHSVSDDHAIIVTLGSPSGEVFGITAGEVAFGQAQDDAADYLARADVTDLLKANGAGEYFVGNIAAVEAQGSYAGWALAVVYDDDELPLRHRIVTDPFDWVAPEDPFQYAVDLPSPVVAAGAAQLDVVAFEGERGFKPETLLVGGQNVGGVNPFDSSIIGERNPSHDNNLGVDIDAYDLTIDTPDATLGISATSDKDGIRFAVLGLTVDLDE
jgi:hypothetical protein